MMWELSTLYIRCPFYWLFLVCCFQVLALWHKIVYIVVYLTTHMTKMCDLGFIFTWWFISPIYFFRHYLKFLCFGASVYCSVCGGLFPAYCFFGGGIKMAKTWSDWKTRKNPRTGLYWQNTRPGSLYGIMETLYVDSGTRDLSYSLCQKWHLWWWTVDFNPNDESPGQNFLQCRGIHWHQF